MISPKNAAVLGATARPVGNFCAESLLVRNPDKNGRQYGTHVIACPDYGVLLGVKPLSAARGGAVHWAQMPNGKMDLSGVEPLTSTLPV